MEFLARLSRGMLAFLAISVGILLIIIANPLPTVCDSQYEHFTEKTKSILTIDKKLKVKPTKTRFVIAFEQCRNENSVGGCYEFFVLLRDVLRELDNTPEACYRDFGQRPVIKETLVHSLQLIIRLAWGEKMPASYRESTGWLEAPNIVTFCELMDKYTKFYGKEAIGQLARQTLPQLPEAQKVKFEQAWPRLILSYPCQTVL